MQTLGNGRSVDRSESTAHRLDPVLVELDAKLAACTDEEDKRRTASALSERESRVIGVYRQVSRYPGAGYTTETEQEQRGLDC